jgi:NAD(P)-dependent dehydrogenase (short-subunit alcohol dehydrogenase family)
MQDLRGKSAFITGAGSGIGQAIAESFAREGVAVAIADIDAEAGARACEQIKSGGGHAVSVQCDVTSEASLADAADEASSALGPIHLLVNNAGAFTVAPLEQTKRRDWEWLLEVNVIGVVNGLHTFLPRMRAHEEPCHIVNTASVSGHIGVAGLSIYTATKFAVVGLSECLRLELADSPIDVSVLCPGIVKTGLLDSSRKHRAGRHGGGGGEALDQVPMDAVIESGSNPAELGDQVVSGIRQGDFYILTHPNLKPAFEMRFNEILSNYREQ